EKLADRPDGGQTGAGSGSGELVGADVRVALLPGDGRAPVPHARFAPGAAVATSVAVRAWPRALRLEQGADLLRQGRLHLVDHRAGQMALKHPEHRDARGARVHRPDVAEPAGHKG